MQGVIYEEATPWVFLIMTVVIGGGTAWLTGRAVAMNWRPLWTLVVYVLLLTGALRFLHFALFEGAFVSLESAERNRAALYFMTVDLVVLMIAAAVGWRVTRAYQMTTQYRWLYERTGPFTWRRRAGSAAATFDPDAAGGKKTMQPGRPNLEEEQHATR
ncbi:MAG TPA: hypothetical protein VMP00_16340 [Burkholderiales bacterium]|nr:hypothetical protein [Burkholderiales bacterium]